jgi:hypothetical protein
MLYFKLSALESWYVEHTIEIQKTMKLLPVNPPLIYQ